MLAAKIADTNRREFVVDQLVAFLRNERLAPGAKLPPEAELADMFGVSRTVVREAMQSLQATGAIRIEQGRGTFVSEHPLSQPFGVWATMNDHRIGEVFEVRMILEGEAAALAAARRDPADLAAIRRILEEWAPKTAQVDWLGVLESDIAFHRAVTRAARLPLLAEMLEVAIPHWLAMTGQVARERDKLARLGFGLDEHIAIYAAIERGDVEASRTAMRGHLANSRERRLKNEAALRAATAGEARQPARRKRGEPT